MKIYEIQQGSNTILFVAVPICILLLGLIALIIAAYISSRNARFVVKNDCLEIRATLYSRKIPLSELKRDEIVRINTETDKGWGTKWRTNGIGLPGYGEGWFRLKNGKKALLFITDKTKTVLVPTKNDYILMISPADPDGFIQQMKM